MTDLYEFTKPEKRNTWIPPWVLRRLPSERYRATVLLILGGLAGYLSPPLVQAFTDRWQFPLEAARIEQLRHDVATVPCDQSQQVLALVMTTNFEIRRKHTERTLWYTKPFVASGWLAVPLIAVPCETLISKGE